MAIKLCEHTYGSHIYMRMMLDDKRIEEIDVFYRKDGSCVYKTSADHGTDEAHVKTRQDIIRAFNELY